jgi:hypothetical protein
VVSGAREVVPKKLQIEMVEVKLKVNILLCGPPGSIELSVTNLEKVIEKSIKSIDSTEVIVEGSEVKTKVRW